MTVLKADKQESLLVSGCLNGSVIVWENRETDLVRKWSCWEFESAITDAFIHEDSKLLALGSQQGKMVIYNIYTRERFRILYHPDNMPVHKMVLSLQPFGSLVFYSEEDGKLYVYSVNGQQLSSRKFKEGRLTDLQISADSNNMEFIVSPFLTLGIRQFEWRHRGSEHPFLRQPQGLQSIQEGADHLTVDLAEGRRFDRW